MKKVVYNACFGGFGLSRDAFLLLVLLGFPVKPTPLNKSGMTEAEFPLEGLKGFRSHPQFTLLLKDGMVYDCNDLNHPYDQESAILRSHPALVKVVELLGPRASGSFAKLTIAELEDEVLYRIDEYDGNESVVPFTSNEYVAGHIYRDIPLPVDLDLNQFNQDSMALLA